MLGGGGIFNALFGGAGIPFPGSWGGGAAGRGRAAHQPKRPKGERLAPPKGAVVLVGPSRLWLVLQPCLKNAGRTGSAAPVYAPACPPACLLTDPFKHPAPLQGWATEASLTAMVWVGTSTIVEGPAACSRRTSGSRMRHSGRRSWMMQLPRSSSGCARACRAGQVGAALCGWHRCVGQHHNRAGTLWGRAQPNSVCWLPLQPFLCLPNPPPPISHWPLGLHAAAVRRRGSGETGAAAPAAAGGPARRPAGPAAAPAATQ